MIWCKIISWACEYKTSVSIPTNLPALNPWSAIVSVNNPVCEIYVASVAVLCVAANILLPDAFVLIDPTQHLQIDVHTLNL